ncbi:hypothetical protein PINS_up000175 [Pythium insidiosum]|nr:hypothetical protein PINS_up000175 [Pythium insidiosum]
MVAGKDESPPRDATESASPVSQPLRTASPPALLSLAATSVGKALPVETIAAHFALLPSGAQELLIRALRDARLRRLERLLSGCSSPSSRLKWPSRESTMESDWDDLLQAEWRRRCAAKSLAITPTYSSSSETLFRDPLPAARDARQLYWEHSFRMQLRRDAQPAKEWPPRQLDLSLFSDVVRTVRTQARELVPRTSHWMSQLPLLRRLEVHHATDQQGAISYWASLETVITMAPALSELCFFHGRLSGALLVNLAKALRYRRECKSLCNRPIQALELVSVKFRSGRPHVPQELVDLFGAYVGFTSVRISSAIADMDNAELLATLLTSQPKLTQLSLEHNDLEDAALTGALRLLHRSSRSPSPTREDTSSDLAKSSTPRPLPLQTLRLGNNALSAGAMQAICEATLDGALALARLELRNNLEIGDAGVHALVPMLRQQVETVPLHRTIINHSLTFLDLRNCHIGIEGVTELFCALSDNTTLLSLDLSHNFFGSAFGDVVANFLESNQVIQRLHLNYVGLGHSGCTAQLCDALLRHRSLRVISFGANRLRDEGATMLFKALAKRSVSLPVEAVDMSANLISVDGLEAITEALTCCAPGDTRSRDTVEVSEQRAKRQRLSDADGDRSRPAHEQTPNVLQVNLLNNDLAGDPRRCASALKALRSCVETVLSNEWTSRASVYDDEM